MKGASAEPLAKINRPPSSRRKITIGANHHFFRALRKLQNSLMMASLLIVLSFLALNLPRRRPNVKPFYNFSELGRRAGDKAAETGPPP